MELPCDVVGDGPALILLHAGVADRRMWSDLLAPLAQAGYRVVAVDLPGFGDADAAGSPAGPWVDIAETMDALGLADAAVVGVSFGGVIAERFAYVYPQRVTALVLVSAAAPGHAFSDELVAAQDREVEAFEADDLDGALAAVLDTWTREDAPAVREKVAVMQRRAFELQSLVEETDPDDPLDDDPALLIGITAPTLVMSGAQDWEDFRVCADVLAAALPDARLVTIDGAGHLPPLEQPDEFRTAVLSFLAEAHASPR
ncbi:MAG TPA: alpha/beta hydrolase [Solirubrobacteraceae bacterium]|nr:alpha/beta hydrolase [Solirubrobacteraceae bacterium]